MTGLLLYRLSYFYDGYLDEGKSTPPGWESWDNFRIGLKDADCFIFDSIKKFHSPKNRSL